MRHGGLALDIPETWSDFSTLLFVAPSRDDKLPTASSVGHGGEAVSVTFLVSDQKPQEILAAHSTSIEEASLEVTVLEEGPFESPLGSAWHHLQRLVLAGQPVLQIVVVISARGLAIVATAAAPEVIFPHCRQKLMGILRSMRTSQRA